jgi:hypothetical protein
VGGLEIFAGRRDDLVVGWKIGGFHDKNDFHQFWVMFSNVRHQLCLGISRTDNENGSCKYNVLRSRAQDFPSENFVAAVDSS